VVIAKSSLQQFEWESFTLLIPVLNEAANIGVLLGELSQLYPGMRVLVLDDGSTDGTEGVVRKSAESYSQISIDFINRAHCSEHGITASVLHGLSLVTSQYVGVMDGDRQHPAKELGVILRKLSDADLVLAARRPYKENQGWHRILVTRFATRLAHVALQSRGIVVADPMSGFFVGKTSLIAQTVSKRGKRFELKGYKVLFDLLMQLPKGVSIKQHEYQFALREHGTSKLRLRHALYFARALVTEFFFSLPNNELVTTEDRVALDNSSAAQQLIDKKTAANQ
jgi:dolichol-phosphate mannosyltransferase